MSTLRLFTHAGCEPPGYIVDLMERMQLPYQQVCLSDGQQVPMTLEKVDGLIFMGGPGNVNEPEPWMQQELELIQKAAERDIPMLGICLGAQLMCKALGGTVWPAESVEVGWHPVHLLPAARDYDYFTVMPDSFEVFQWHAHNCSPPSSATELATSECTPCQAFGLDRHLALQFHLEMTPHIIRGLLDKYGDDLQGESNCVQSRREILDDLQQKCLDTFMLADQMLIPWLRSIQFRD